MSWLWLDLRARLAQRTTLVAAAMLAYALLALPFLLDRPPPHVSEALMSWFGTSGGFVLFLYLWTDIAMNKVVGLLAVVFAGQVLVAERDTGLLDVWRSKPITMRGLFLVRAGSAILLMWTLYLATVLVGLPWFAWRVEGFEPGVFVLSSVVHAGAAAFAVALVAAIAVVVRQRTLGMVVGLIVVFSLIGASFVGFYNPAWAWVGWVNPFGLGSQVVGHVQDLRVVHVVGPLLGLMGSTGLALAFGAWAAGRWEEGS